VDVKKLQNHTAIPPYDFTGCTGTTLLLLYFLRYTVAVTVTCKMQWWDTTGQAAGSCSQSMDREHVTAGYL